MEIGRASGGCRQAHGGPQVGESSLPAIDELQRGGTLVVHGGGGAREVQAHLGHAGRAEKNGVCSRERRDKKNLYSATETKYVLSFSTSKNKVSPPPALPLSSHRCDVKPSQVPSHWANTRSQVLAAMAVATPEDPFFCCMVQN